MLEKLCKKCGKTGLFFPENKATCKPCLADLQRLYRKSQKGIEHWKRNGRKYTLKKRYGLSIKEYEKIREDQNECCAICGINPEERIETYETHRMLHVDHDHKTGKVRGLLCNGFNRAIGLIQDNPITALNI